MGFDELVQHDASELTKGTLPAERLPSEGVDADTLDGVEGSNYARLNQNETVTGNYTFQGQDATIPLTVQDEFDGRNKIELRLNDTDTALDRGFTIRGWNGQDVIRQRAGDNITHIVANNQIQLHDGDAPSVIVKEGNTGVGGILAANSLDVNGAAVIGSGFAGSNTAPTDGLLVEGRIEMSSNGAGIFVNSNGDVVAVDDSGNTNVLT